MQPMTWIVAGLCLAIILYLMVRTADKETFRNLVMILALLVVVAGLVLIVAL